MTVCKLGHQGQLIFSWQGDMLIDQPDRLVILASWTMTSSPMFLGYTVFEPGDSFLETYYPGRWFSIWEVRSQRNGRTKGWYCNICRPLERHGDELRFEDMELDVFVFPDGRYVVLDEDDLERASVSAADREGAQAGLGDVLSMIEQRRAPFDRIGPPRRVLPFWPDEPRRQS